MIGELDGSTLRNILLVNQGNKSNFCECNEKINYNLSI